jgi:hypothetical protein
MHLVEKDLRLDKGKHHRSKSSVMTPKKKQRPTSVLVSLHTETTDYLGVQELFGIRRGLAYHLAQTGAIQSISLKEPGEARGKRLFDVASIRAFLASKRDSEIAGKAAKQ